MKLLLAFLIPVFAFGQEAATQAKPEEKAPAKTEQTAAAENPAPAASDGLVLTGSFDFGYRWVGDIRGSSQEYRSVVNLGEGPKLTGLDFTILDPKHRLFDRIDARGDGWGGDPYSTAHLQAIKKRVYDLRVDYRNIAYFNAIPSFANPFAPGGFDERAFDTRRRDGYVDLELLPGGHILPYLVFERNSSYGHGVATWVQDNNDEFAVPTLLRDSTDSYRGGVRVEYNRYHLTLEQGGTTFKEDDQAGFNGVNYGDRTAPFLGSTLQLNNLQQAYGIRGTSLYTKIMATASPVSRVDLYGQFLWAEPKTDANYFDLANGNFGLISSLLLYSGQFNLGTSVANQPHVVGNAGMEVRPFRNLRVVQSWMTDRDHTSGFGALTEQILLTPTATGASLAQALNTLQVVNYNRYQVEAIWDVTSKLALRGGWRREFGDATVRAGVFDQSGLLASRDLKRDVGLAGITARPIKNLSMNVDYEGASTTSDYFRTSLYNYHRVRAYARYQPVTSLSVQANFAYLTNENPSPDIRYNLDSRSSSLSLYWTPEGGKHLTLMGEYSRSTFDSNINYLAFPFYLPSVSLYRENGHTATSMLDVNLPKIGGMTPKLTAGGSMYISAGTRATSYYEPVGKLSLPLQKHVQWNTEWRWYGFGETAYLYEGFRAHLFMTGLRLMK
ncbi:MAG: hypothetical protein KGN36_17040 [Acidobacteriota bacterium]|nr:hypothetical protein [Acidobacteriota bacterium]